MTGTCSGRYGCGATFRGRQEHCTECHQTFAATGPGDAHRTGHHDRHPWQEDGRRCRTPDEMRAVGMWQDNRGIWHGRASASGTQKRLTALPWTTTPPPTGQEP